MGQGDPAANNRQLTPGCPTNGRAVHADTPASRRWGDALGLTDKEFSTEKSFGRGDSHRHYVECYNKPAATVPPPTGTNSKRPRPFREHNAPHPFTQSPWSPFLGHLRGCGDNQARSRPGIPACGIG